MGADLEEDEVELDIEDVDEDLGHMLQGLLDARDSRDVDEETEEVASGDESESEEQEPAEDEVPPQEVARFNNYMDAIYRRMNAALRAKMMDPMTLNLNQKIKKDVKEKKSRTERSAIEDEE